MWWNRRFDLWIMSIKTKISDSVSASNMILIALLQWYGMIWHSLPDNFMCCVINLNPNRWNIPLNTSIFCTCKPVCPGTGPPSQVRSKRWKSSFSQPRWPQCEAQCWWAGVQDSLVKLQLSLQLQENRIDVIEPEIFHAEKLSTTQHFLFSRKFKSAPVCLPKCHVCC